MVWMALRAVRARAFFLRLPEQTRSLAQAEEAPLVGQGLLSLARTSPSQLALRHALHELLVALAVAFRRHERDLELVARALALESLFQSRDEVAMALDVGERIAARGAVEHFPLIILEGVVDQDHAVGGYFHDGISGLVEIASLHDYFAVRAAGSASRS